MRRASSPAPAAQLRPGAAAGQGAVQEDRQLELGAEAIGEDERLRAGGAAVLVGEMWMIGATSIAPTRG